MPAVELFIPLAVIALEPTRWRKLHRAREPGAGERGQEVLQRAQGAAGAELGRGGQRPGDEERDHVGVRQRQGAVIAGLPTDSRNILLVLRFRRKVGPSTSGGARPVRLGTHVSSG